MASEPGAAVAAAAGVAASVAGREAAGDGASSDVAGRRADSAPPPPVQLASMRLRAAIMANGRTARTVLISARHRSRPVGSRRSDRARCHRHGCRRPPVEARGDGLGDVRKRAATPARRSSRRSAGRSAVVSAVRGQWSEGARVDAGRPGQGVLRDAGGSRSAVAELARVSRGQLRAAPCPSEWPWPSLPLPRSSAVLPGARRPHALAPAGLGRVRALPRRRDPMSDAGRGVQHPAAPRPAARTCD